MIFRSLFVGYTNNPQQIRLKNQLSCYAALVCRDDMVFLYVESNEGDVVPERLVQGSLIPFPNGNLWMPAIEVFHYSRPVGTEQWRRKLQKTPYFQFNRLQHDKIASYIFYHYQYQEEYPGDGDKYGILYLFDDQLIFYLEDPEELETVKMPGLLQTTNSPLCNWEALMHEHFTDEWQQVWDLQHSDYITFDSE